MQKGMHYAEFEVMSDEVSHIYMGVARPDLEERNKNYADSNEPSAWLFDAYHGGLYGNGYCSEPPRLYGTDGSLHTGDRLAISLNLEEGSLRFFDNGRPHGPGWDAGSVRGPVVWAVLMYSKGESIRLVT